MTNLRAIQKNYYPSRFVRSAWYLLIRSSWSLIWRSSVFFSSGPEALRSSRPRASTCSQSIAADTARAAALKVGGKAGRLINTLWREILREGLQPEPSGASGRTSKRRSDGHKAVQHVKIRRAARRSTNNRIVRRWYYYRDNNELVELSVLRHKRK